MIGFLLDAHGKKSQVLIDFMCKSSGLINNLPNINYTDYEGICIIFAANVKGQYGLSSLGQKALSSTN